MVTKQTKYNFEMLKLFESNNKFTKTIVNVPLYTPILIAVHQVPIRLIQFIYF